MTAKGNYQLTIAAPPATRSLNLLTASDIDPQAAEWLDVVNPATAEALGRVPVSDVAEVTRAIDAAQAAYPEWRRTPLEDRIQYFFKLKKMLEEHLEDFVRIIVHEQTARRLPNCRPNCAGQSRMSRSPAASRSSCMAIILKMWRAASMR